MSVLIDTGPILSLADQSDPRHVEVKKVWKSSRGPFVTSIAIIPEACYLLLKYLGPEAELRFLESWQSGEFQVEPVGSKDLQRILEVLNQYKDQQFGFADASLFALAERLKIRSILTLDQRHFSAYRPSHCSHWEFLLGG